jgi:hypothetical protein
MISFQVFAGLTGYHSEPEYLKSCRMAKGESLPHLHYPMKS